MREEEHVFLGFREESENKGRGGGGRDFLYTKTALEICEQALHLQSPMLLKGIRGWGLLFYGRFWTFWFLFWLNFISSCCIFFF